MSIENAEAFLKELKSDDALLRKVASSSEDVAIQCIIEAGTAKKMSFTADELKFAARTVSSAKGKLSEKELSAVAGGQCKIILLSVACSDL